ncbi:hypothetical protein F5884DRAFT_878567 [Xylogone sp. PMI_703]|nr:hypothetical protein F5884DRAFT_878567 [Xylogone sp. PMI_703]
MCARLIAKTVVPGTYPSPERMQEALAVAKKLYALPEVPIAEWIAQITSPSAKRYTAYDPARPVRQSTLLYRRLAIELALRLGEFRTAAALLSQGLKVDGFSLDGSLYHYLLLPGIYDALPLLAEGEKQSNPFFIPKDDARVIVGKIIEALEVRATKGRQWELAADKVGWKELLDRLVVAAWNVYRREYRSMGVVRADDILYDPATEEEIQRAEEQVGPLPADFKEMVRIANGFRGGYHFFGGGIAGIQSISRCEDGDDLEHNMDEFEAQGMRQDEITGDMVELQAGSECDGFRHFIIPPEMWKANVVGREVEEGEYQYWHVASWRGGIDRWNSIRDYVASCVEEVEDMVERGKVGDFDGESVDSTEDGDSGATSENIGSG